mgnify:CR=1 FL=1
MSKKRIKQPVLEQRGKVKLPSSSDMERPDELHPVFSFEYMVPGFDVEGCEKTDRASLALTLLKLSKLTWAQIKQSHRHGLGFETIDNGSIRAGIPPIITPDVRLLAFRFSGKKPMVGYRIGRTFFIVWLDRDFTLYDHG